MNRIFLTCLPFSLVFAAGCAHPQQVTLTSASAAAPPVPAAAEVETTKSAPVEPAAALTSEGALASDPSKGGDAVPPAESAGSEEVSFAQLSAALGDDKVDLSIEHTDAPASKGLDANGYAAVGAMHQNAADGVKHVGELQVSGGITAAQVHGVVRDSAARLRECYARGLVADPRLAGRVMVSFSVDAHGAVGDVESQSDSLPGEVTSCVTAVFSSLTFSAPKAPPAKVVVPVDFNKDS
jgi:hypothetical protein